jgi:tetratricopeptide (TPR) repeat protein
MARYAYCLVTLSILGLLAGCEPSYEGSGQIAPPTSLSGGSMATVQDTSAATEAGLVEQVALGRQTYKEALEKLIDYYSKSGNNMKLQWAKSELKALNQNPQYRFIIQAEVAGADLKASSSIPAADALYNDGMKYYHEGKPLIGTLALNEGKLRMALDRFNQLMRDYPTSDKIDDAAFHAGQAYEDLKDYTIAATYYTRAFQWDENTPYPARFKAAFVYDKYLFNREKALEDYKAYLAHGAGNGTYKEIAEQRVAELQKEIPVTTEPPLKPAVPPLP